MTSFLELVSVSGRVGSTRSRREKTAELVDFLQRLSAGEIAVAVAYLSGLVPQGKTGIGYASVRAATQTPAASTSGLTLQDVHQRLGQLAQLSGKGSAGERLRLLGELFSLATHPEQEFLARLLMGGLRQGALEGMMAEAIASAAKVSPSSVRRAIMFANDAGLVAHAALTEGEAGLNRFRLQLLSPLRPMLASTAPDVEQALAELQELSLEYKLDGARLQVHRDQELVKIFSREGNEVTGALPEVVARVRAMPARQLVLDGEAIALRPDGTPHPFQVTMRRFGRKRDAPGEVPDLRLTPFFFDLLHLDGLDLVDQPLTERVRALAEVVPAEARIPSRVTASAEEANAFYDAAIAHGHEGVMAKKLSAPYEAGRRGASWLKVKPAHTLDLVVLAVEWGSGRREGWLSNLHLGARDPSTGGFVMLGKTFKGMTDEMLAWQTRWFLDHELSRDAHTVYVKPELVAEIALDSVQASPHYPSGMALRFARVKRYREDKRADEADTIDTVRRLFARSMGTDR